MTKEDALNFIRQEYSRLDQLCNVDTSRIEISLSTRMSRQLGCFTCKRNGLHEQLRIKISERIIDDPELFLDVIRHEYAHAIVHIRNPFRKHVHDNVWKTACIEVGCTPKATRKIAELNEAVNERPYKYLVRCKNCGCESKYKSEGKVVKILLKKMHGYVICKQCGAKSFTIIKV